MQCLHSNVILDVDVVDVVLKFPGLLVLHEGNWLQRERGFEVF